MGESPSETSHLVDDGQLLRDVFRSSLDIIIASDLDRKIRVFNAAAERAFGYTAGEILGRDVTVLYADPEQMLGVLHAVANENIYEGEVLNRACDGSTFSSYLSATAVRAENGEITGYMGVSRDVTQLRHTQAELAISQTRYLDLLEAANSIILRWNSDGVITFMNEYGLKFFGFTSEELLGQPVVGSIVPRAESTGRDLVDLMDEIHRYPERFTNNQNQNIRKDGRLVWVSWTNKHVQWEQDGPHEILSIGNDITLLKEYEIALGERTTELAAANTALTDSNELLRAADRMKSVFIASMSHELRTPLNSIIGFTGILLQQLPGPLNGEQEKQLSIVRESARHLLDLINEVLDVSKIEAGRVDLAIEDFELHVLAGAVLESLASIAGPKGIALRGAVPTGIVLHSDLGRIRQILLNLVGNAVKFTEEGEVTVWAEAGEGRVCIYVTDTGPGIAVEDRLRLFKPFQQIDMALTRRHSGTGLGLYLSRKIARMLGGGLSLSKSDARGSVFVVELPLRFVEAQDPAAPNVDEDDNGG